MNDFELGKRMVEEMVLEQMLDTFSEITCRKLTDEMDGEPLDRDPHSPDFVIGLDGRAFGIELTEIRGAFDGWSYLEKATRLALQKDESYERRGLFKFPIALVFHATEPP